MLHIGCHLSTTGGFEAMGKTALSIGADTFAFFTRNPRGMKAKPIDPDDAAALRTILEEHHFAPLVAHAPYTMNACAAKPELRELANTMMKDDLARMEYLPGNLYNFHPGSHVKQGVETGISFIAELLNDVMSPDQHTTILLETMAGKGTEVGRTFEEIRAIIDKVELSDKIGVCLDTCHIWDGGYDVAAHLDDVLAAFDSTIGIDRLKAVHLNDSLNPLAAHKDRHAKIGAGTIGFDALARVTQHPKLRDLPFILETPNDLAGYADEIKRLRAAFSAE